MKMSESVLELSVALSKFQEKVEQPAKQQIIHFLKVVMFLWKTSLVQ
ncbi:hypothetical protein [Listeria monocytogenes]